MTPRATSRVPVTGACGLLGAQLVEAFRPPAHVVGVERNPCGATDHRTCELEAWRTGVRESRQWTTPSRMSSYTAPRWWTLIVVRQKA